MSTYGTRIRVIIKRTDEPIGHVTNIMNTLKNLQNTVGGHIEAVTMTPNVIILCNEEGRILGLPYNCTIGRISFFGDIIVVGVDGEDFGDCPLSRKDWKEIFLGVKE